jgi:hypothetical protein
MICPECQSELTRRSHRRGIVDLMLTFSGLRPWRCRSCEERFYAWQVPMAYSLYAHCPRCGNFDLQRISRDRVDEGAFRWVERLLGFAAYRCDPCRMRFFSVLPYHRIVPDEGAVNERPHRSQQAV